MYSLYICLYKYIHRDDDFNDIGGLSDEKIRAALSTFLTKKEEIDDLMYWLKRSNNALAFSSSYLELDVLAKSGEKIVNRFHSHIIDNGDDNNDNYINYNKLNNGEKNKDMREYCENINDEKMGDDNNDIYYNLNNSNYRDYSNAFGNYSNNYYDNYSAVTHVMGSLYQGKEFKGIYVYVSVYMHICMYYTHTCRCNVYVSTQK
jgi:hypothetical protein